MLISHIHDWIILLSQINQIHAGQSIIMLLFGNKCCTKLFFIHMGWSVNPHQMITVVHFHQIQKTVQIKCNKKCCINNSTKDIVVYGFFWVKTQTADRLLFRLNIIKFKHLQSIYNVGLDIAHVLWILSHDLLYFICVSGHAVHPILPFRLSPFPKYYLEGIQRANTFPTI